MADEVKGEDTKWVFDRPVLMDGLLWAGVLLGVFMFVMGTTWAQFNAMSWWFLAFALLGNFLVGIFVVGVVGGSVRWFWRGYRGVGQPH